MRLYKLTNQNDMTENNTKWGPNVTKRASTGVPLLCTETVIHAYTDPRLAVLFNPIHANIFNPKLWLAEGTPAIRQFDKVGCKQLTTLHELPLPDLFIEKRVEYAIRCASLVYKEAGFVTWASNWLNGTDRSAGAAAAAYAAAAAAGAGAAYAAYAADAAYAAAYAAAGAAAAAAAAAYAAAGAAAAAAAAAAMVGLLDEVFGLVANPDGLQ